LRLALIALTFFVAKAPPSATEALKQRDAEVRALLPPPGTELTPALREKIERALTRAVDMEAMAKAALGKHWNEQPPAKRQKFLKAFVTRFRRVSGDQIEAYRSSKTEFLPEEKQGDTVRVPTRLVVKGEPTTVVYVMRWDGKEWRIVDIIVDDVSTVENYRSSFSRIIAKEGFDALINRLSKTA
jgi:phospholipid transport system substrate-binding protein